MCSYPCFGLSKTGFTPPSQLLKLIFLKKQKLRRCRSRNRQPKLHCCRSRNRQRKLRRCRCRNRQRKLSHQFIYIYIFSWVFTSLVTWAKLDLAPEKKTKKMLCFHAYDQYPQNILNISFFWKINIWSFKMCFGIVFLKHKNYFLAFWIL